MSKTQPIMKYLGFILLLLTCSSTTTPKIHEKSSSSALLQIESTSTFQKENSSPIGDFDFWIGVWKTESSVPPNWEVSIDIDSVKYLLNGKLIEEVFTKTQSSNFQRGYLFYLKREGRWRHTIYDTKWGEYTFYGNKEGDDIVLYSDPKSTRPGLRREIFYNISENEFDYKWEASQDEGKTWHVIWKIHYIRKI